MRRLGAQHCFAQFSRPLHISRPTPTVPRRTNAPQGGSFRHSKQAAPSNVRPPEVKAIPGASSGHDTADVIFKARKVPLLAAGVVALGCGLYFSMMVSSLLRTDNVLPDTANPTGRPPAFTRDSAQQFDQSLDASENSMGVTSLRQRLGERASGHVLEVALGTGRNMIFYNWSVIAPGTRGLAGKDQQAPSKAARMHLSTFTGVDVSSDMLGVAIDKLPGAVPALAGIAPAISAKTPNSINGAGVGFSYLDGKIRIAQCDIQQGIPLPDATVTSARKYDTVVQTFGLCSVTDPVQVLRNLVDVVQPGTGRIFLIEHGRSWWRVVNMLLDWSAKSHFAKYGCWWNRDIISLLDEAVRTTPGLEVVHIERPFITQLGTTVWVELRFQS